MGCRPAIAEPTARPVSAASEVGVSRMRSGYFCLRPLVVPPAPCGTPRPITYTEGSAAITWSVASRMASAVLRMRSSILFVEHVGKHLFLLRIRRGFGKRNGLAHLGACLLLHALEPRFVGDALREQLGAHELHAVALQPALQRVLLAQAVLVVHQRSAVRHVAVGQTLKHRGPAARPYPRKQGRCLLRHIVKIVAVCAQVRQAEALGDSADVVLFAAALREVGVDRPGIVFYYQKEWQLVERGEVVRFVHDTLFRRAVAHKADHDTVLFVVFLLKRPARCEWYGATQEWRGNDKVYRLVYHVHRAALAARGAVAAAQELADHTLEIASFGEIVSVRAVGREYLIFEIELRTDAGTDRFLSDIKVHHRKEFFVDVELHQLLLGDP